MTTPTFRLPTPRSAPPLTVRRFAALVAGKSAGVASRMAGRGGGTSIAGMVARRVDPGILRALVAEQGVTVLAITGSNGKTTSARFTAAILRGAGLPVAHNQAGANLVQGVTSLAVGAADLRGRVEPTVMVTEIDEGALPLVAPEIKPRGVLVTNLFRDQLDRYGEIYAVADAFEVVAAVDNGPSLLKALTEHRPDVAVVDVRLPPTFTDEGLRAALEARSRVPGLPILVLSQ